MVQAGDKCDFIGTLIVVPDVGQLRMEGVLHSPSPTHPLFTSCIGWSGSARVETSTRVKTGEGYNSEGVTGLKALGVRDLNYRLAFLAGSVQSTKSGVSRELGVGVWFGSRGVGMEFGRDIRDGGVVWKQGCGYGVWTGHKGWGCGLEPGVWKY